jgi:hypothetical protein
MKTILGWLIDFCRLTISLPSNKFIAWTESINKILTRGTLTTKELETTIGQLGHLGAIMPFVYYFLSRLRNLQKKATNRRTIDICQDCHDDLNLMLSFLHKAHTGIDMNLIAFRRPMHIYRSDSCPYGLGGYLHEEFAWRFKLPENYRFRASNNLLKFITSITPWIDLISKRLWLGDCALSMTDSTTSTGWLKKMNFLEKRIRPNQRDHLPKDRWTARQPLHQPRYQRILPVVPRKENSMRPKSQNTYTCTSLPSFPFIFRLFHYPMK